MLSWFFNAIFFLPLQEKLLNALDLQFKEFHQRLSHNGSLLAL